MFFSSFNKIASPKQKKTSRHRAAGEKRGGLVFGGSCRNAILYTDKTENLLYKKIAKKTKKSSMLQSLQKNK